MKNKKDIKDMKNLERTLKALANKRRLAIVKYLKECQSASVGDIAEKIDLSFRATSRHLGVLSSADIVEKEQKSLQMLYWISENQKTVAKQIISSL